MIKSKDIVSVIIPSYNASKTIEKTLISLENQDCNRDKFEVIIVDDGSNDSTKEIVQKYIVRNKIQLEYLYQAKMWVGIARNLGISYSVGKILAFTDADCICDIQRIATIYQKIYKQWYKLIWGYTFANDSIIYPWKIAPVNQTGITANLAVDYRVIEGPVFSWDFMWMFWDDTHFILRMEDAGIGPQYVPEMKVEHPANILTLQKLIIRFWGRANDVLLYKKYWKRVLPSFSPVFQPILFHRISIFTILNVFLLLSIIWVLWNFWVVWLLLYFCFLFVLFYIFVFDYFVIYKPKDALISPKDKITTFLFLIISTPLYYYYRIKGNIKFRFFML